MTALHSALLNSQQSALLHIRRGVEYISTNLKVNI